ncbi:chromosome segregation protein SMC [Brevundimonas subvibrioides]|uniref:Chromosome partition protein Smc n=1 Tax=Brevundimonas subvibrioides (strain ATCC 15264 / DSM 4735 / LMG 14903 / NBRC 16000 / CB 81) TaxID=633149 RepID=D9QM82_BRESC|nr:chromosome segregation protein SMC [Brevundimonas subvibrioides]ADL02008.1 chromosome segregation protein SMC [Brevundimonas subvibrioides ATCC 15264]
MQFQRLRLVGFKSFVDPAEVQIEPGLTGVVGPNGCGKSNVLESMRWVMGANSAKAMRGTGMDDVIFAGASNRPPRNHAEVSLTIDNAQRKAPQPFTDSAIIEVSRRIDRGQGSTYRINGKEVRARDVQLLFADASTGANSPALVRQGQISELIAAKPQNRRRILEEAGGVAGLHTRRHEAELRLKAAETNLERLDDIGRELETALTRLKREARQAEKYKKISAEIRALQAALLFVRWNDARLAAEGAAAELAEADRAVAEATGAAARAQTAALSAQEGLKPAREEDAVAAALLHRASLERDRLDMAEQQARAEVDRLTAERQRIANDTEREIAMAGDAEAELARLGAELAVLTAEVAAAPERGPELERALVAAEDARRAADGEVERIAGTLAAVEARANAETARKRDAEARVARARTALDAARREREALGPLETPELAGARSALDAATTALAEARAAVEAAETTRGDRARAEQEARTAARAAEDRLGRLQTEARGLASLLVSTRRDHPPALDKVSATKGYEAALAAALGDDLDAALDPKAAAHWGGAEATAPVWPAGIEPLSGKVEAPEALAARLAFCGIADKGEAARLARTLPPGARLVTREGDLFRWDGFVSRAEAPRPAAIRLAQRSRLSELEADIDAGKPALADAQAALKAATEAFRASEEAVKTARLQPFAADKAVTAARDRVEALGRDQARREARAQALDETLTRQTTQVEAAEAALAEAASVEAPSGTLQALKDELAAARTAADTARSASAAARADRDAEARERVGREQRLVSLTRERDGWATRAKDSTARIAALETDATRVAALLLQAERAPEALAAQRSQLMDALTAAETRRKAAADALSIAEGLATEADRAGRAAETAASAAREARAGLAARSEAAAERLLDAENNVRETAQMSPDELGRKLTDDAIARPPDAAGAESLLYGLEREREQLGAVNLRAEDEAEEYGERLNTMRIERSDLTGAIARLRDGIDELNAEGRERLTAAFDIINDNFKSLFEALFGGGQAELKLVESDDPLEAGLEIFACPPGKRLSVMSLMSGGEQALTAAALIFAVFLANPAPVCVLDEVDAPLDDANVDRFCRMLNEMRNRTDTRFIVITHNPVTMSRMDRLYGVTMPERGVSQLVSVDLKQAETLVA